MPLKNQFLSGISSTYDKTPKQNELIPSARISFNGDCTFDFLGIDSFRRVSYTFTGTGIVYNTIKKTDAEMMPFNGYFESIGEQHTNFQIEILALTDVCKKRGYSAEMKLHASE